MNSVKLYLFKEVIDAAEGCRLGATELLDVHHLVIDQALGVWDPPRAFEALLLLLRARVDNRVVVLDNNRRLSFDRDSEALYG